MSDVDRVKDSIDAVAYISTFVPLRRAGGRFVGRCPFHEEKTPSFSVRPDGLFYCFGCGAGGDILRFIELKEGVEFPEALARAADFAGVQLEERRPAPGAVSRNSDEFAAGLSLLDAAGTYFHRMLLDSSKAEHAREYLEQRQLPQSVWEQFGLGYAWGESGDWTALVRKKGWSLDLSERLGLTASSRSHDRFVNRLMFPIHDENGRPAGFGGRRLNEEDKAKYINSPDSAWFRKGNLLFGLEQARASWKQDRRALVCEGYTDVIRLHLAGFTDAVAPLGTALTDRQAARIAAHVRQVILAFDADDAGVRAALKAWGLLTQRGAEVHILLLPNGEDPDSFVQSAGPDQVARHLESAPLFWPWYLEHHIAATSSTDDRHRQLQKLLERLAEIRDPVYTELLLADVSAAAGVTVDALLKQLRDLQRGRTEPVRAARMAGGRGPAGVEEKLAILVLGDPERRFAIGESMVLDGVHPWLAAVLEGRQLEEPGFREWLGRMAHAEPVAADANQLIQDVRERAADRGLKNRISDLSSREESLRRDGRLDEARELRRQIQDLRQTSQ